MLVKKRQSIAEEKLYPVVLSAIQHDKKPTSYYKLHNELDSAESTYISLYDLLEAVNNGQTFRNGIHAKPSDQHNDYKLTKQEIEFLSKKELTEKERIKATVLMKKQKIKNELKESNQKDINQFIETNLAILDVDDVLGQTDPIEVMKKTGAIALYYTFSHQTLSPVNNKMNRYRLLFDLDNTIRGKQSIKAVQDDIKSNILELYPTLNNQKIGNKSHGIDNVIKMVHGTNKGYIINDNFKSYNTAETLERVKKEQEFERVAQKLESLTTNKTRTTEREIIDIANFLNDMNGLLNHEQWTTLSIGLWNTAQVEKIDDTVVIEALQKLDGYRNNERYYLNFKQPINSAQNNATIGTLIKIATDRGYTRQYHRQPSQTTEQAPQIATSTHNIKEYINEADIYELIKNNDKRILIQSDTNTGKTYASIKASKKYLKENKKSFVYIALPTKALSHQVVQDHNLNQAILGKMNVKKVVNQSIRNGSRLLVGTYDKAEIVHNLLSDYNLIVIADEAHKEVTDYNYRYKAIQALYNLDVSKFIALTGTPSEIDFDTYNSLVKFKLEQPKVLADKLQFIEYSNASKYESITSQIIELEVKKNNQKVLAFINNRKLIDKIARALRTQGLQVATITADNRRSKTYKQILEKQQFDDDTDVVLATIVLADGINIKNSEDYTCIIAPSHHKGANFYNIDMIRQATNRFRNKYKKIIIPFYIMKDLLKGKESTNPRKSEDPYNLERQYQYLLSKAELAKAILQSEFKNKLNEFTPSIAERVAGIFRQEEAKDFDFKRAYKNKQLANQGLVHDETLAEQLKQLESKIWDVDKRAIRQQASKDKETYYSLYPYAFKEAIKRALNVLEVDSIEAHEYFIKAESDDNISEVLKEITKLEMKSEKEKREQVGKILHELVFYELKKHTLETGRVDESLNEWKLLKDKMSSWHYSALTKLVLFMEYDEVMKELKYINNRAKIHELVKSFKAIDEIEKYEQRTSQTITDTIFNHIQSNIIGNAYCTKKELDEHLKQLAKDFKLKGRHTIAKRQRLFKETFKKYFILSNSKSIRINGKVRKQSEYKVIELIDLANKRKLDLKEIEELYSKYLYFK